MERYTAVVICFLISVTTSLPACKYLKSHKLSKKDKQQVEKNGIIHYTTNEFAASIIKECILNIAPKEKYTYFFKNENIAENILKYNHLTDKTAKIIISNLTKHQMDQLRIRDNDYALLYIGRFHILRENIVTVEPVFHSENVLLYKNLKRNNTIGIIGILCSIASFSMGIIFCTEPVKTDIAKKSLLWYNKNTKGGFYYGKRI